MPFQPFLISNMRIAKSIGLEPWLSPPDSFETLENMSINKGVLEKRLGYSLFAQMKYGAAAQTTTTITGIHNYIKNGLPSLLIMDTARANYYNPIDGTMTDVSSDLSSPAALFSGSASDFFHFANWQGVGYMTNNVDQVHQWSGPGSAVTPFNIQISSDTKTNHVDTCRFIFIKDDRILLLDTTEFGDWKSNRLRYSPVLQTDFSASGAGNVDAPTSHRISAAGFIGNDIAVYMQAGGVGSLWLIKSTGNSDIPFKWQKITETETCRAPYSGVEFKDGLVAIGLSNLLFFNGFPIRVKFLDLPHLRDILAEFNDGLIRSTYGYNQKEQDQRHLLYTFADASSSSIDRILDFNVLENNFTVHKSAQSFFVNVIGGFNGQAIPTMAELDDVVTTDGDIVSNITVDSRAVLPIEGNAAGLATPAPFTLIGARNSRVYKWGDGAFDGTDDSNGNIAIAATSARFNPFTKEGRKASCSKIGFLVDNDANASFLVEVFKNVSAKITVFADAGGGQVTVTSVGHGLSTGDKILIEGTTNYNGTFTIANATTDTFEITDTWVANDATGTWSAAYKSKTISCDGSGDKFWVWIFCDGEIGDFHRFKISHTARTNRPRIHATMPFFSAAGRLYLGD